MRLTKSKLNRLDKGRKPLKCYVFFKPDVLLISKDASGNSIIDSILYKSIRCLNMMKTASFYFKSNRSGYAMFFMNYNPKNAELWFNYLIICKERLDEAKVEIKQFDIAENLVQLVWDSNSVIYRFNYKEEIGEQADEIYQQKDKHTWIAGIKNKVTNL